MLDPFTPRTCNQTENAGQSQPESDYSSLLFFSQTEEEHFFATLTALIEEWGVENVTVYMPADWETYCPDSFECALKIVFSACEELVIVASEGSSAAGIVRRIPIKA